MAPSRWLVSKQKHAKKLWDAKELAHVTFVKGEILSHDRGEYYVEVLDVLIPWTPTGDTWQSKLLLIKVAHKNGKPMKNSKPFEDWCDGYSKLYDDSVDYITNQYVEALEKATNDLREYKAFAERVKDKILPFPHS